MAQICRLFRSIEQGRLGFWCPGCDMMHVVRIAGDGAWSFNGDLVRPSFQPSIKTAGFEPITDDEADRIMAGGKVEPRPFLCHCYITDGLISFLPDSTHLLAGKTVPVPALPLRAI